MTDIELTEYLKKKYAKENEECEWKIFSNLTHNISGHKGDDVISYVSAIPNMKGGHLIIGVEDATLIIKGINNFHDYTIENTPLRLLGSCTNLNSEGLWIEPFTTDSGKTIWVIHIPKHLPRKPVFSHRTAWQRSGDSLIPITREREESILQESIRQADDWSALICPEATVKDLDPKAIITARENYKNKFPE